MGPYLILFGAIFFIIIVGAGSYFFIDATKFGVPLGKENVVISSLLEGCDEKRELSIRGIGDIEKEPSIEVIEGGIRYSRAITHLCCREIEITSEVTGSEINIYEDWSGLGCRCECFANIEKELALPSGEYVVSVYEQGTKPGTGEAMEKKLIISQAINI